jgi:hypothetical protein
MSSILGFTTTEREYEMNKKLLCAVGLTVASFAAPSAVFAGETTGGPDPKPTGMRGHANSVCGFSGLEENPTFEERDENEKPGRLTQTPHYRMISITVSGLTSYVPVYATPGTPGEACNPSNP